MQVAKELSDQWNLTRIGEDPVVDVWMVDVSYYVFKISVKVKVMNDVNFPDRNLLFYIYASLVAFLEWITPSCLSVMTQGKTLVTFALYLKRTSHN